MMDLQDGLQVDSQLSELSRVWPWIESAADRNGLSEETRYAMHLCVEEALANVILHGYRGEPGHPILVRSYVSEGALYISIDDQAPPFSPLESFPVQPSGEGRRASLESVTAGGNGIGLMRRFAGSLSHQRLADGNRLTMGFPIPANDASR